MRVQRYWCFDAFVDVKILGAGDDLLSSAAGKPRYVVYSSRVCVQNRCVSTLARNKRSRGAACPGRSARSFFFLFCTCSPTCPFRVYRGKRKYSSPRSPQTFPSGVNSNHQRATNTDVYDWFPLIRMRPMNTNYLGWREINNVRAARPTKHTKFKTNKLTTAVSSG